MSRFSLKSFSFTDVNPIALGIAAMVTAAIATTLAFAVGSLGLLDDTYTMSGVFPESGGLRSGDKVRVAGLQVGEVTGVEPDFERGVVVVTWEVDSGTDIPTDATAEVSLATLLGGRYIRIDAPRTSGGQFEGPFMEALDAADRRIPLERTTLPLGVQDALGQATTTIEEIDAGQINTLVEQFADLAGDNADSFQPLLGDVATLAETLNSRRDTIDSLLDATGRLTDSLASKDQALIVLIDQANDLLDTIVQRRDSLRTLLGSGSDAVTELDRLISTNRDALDSILTDLHDVSTNTLNPNMDAFNETLAVLGPALTGLESTTVQGDWVDLYAIGAGFLQLGDLVDALGGG